MRSARADAATSANRTGLWSFNNGPDVPTPVTDGKYLYVGERSRHYVVPGRQDRAGDLGQPADQARDLTVRRRCWPTARSTSPTKTASTTVIRAGPKFEVLAENDLAGYTLSSPAISDGRIYLRTAEFLYAIGKR